MTRLACFGSICGNAPTITSTTTTTATSPAASPYKKAQFTWPSKKNIAIESASTANSIQNSSISINSCRLPDKMKHEFIWKYGGNEVILTGSFDAWSKSIRMKKNEELGIFKGTVFLNPYETWTFKFVVDGIWRCSLDFPTTSDSNGNVNNIFYAENMHL